MGGDFLESGGVSSDREEVKVVVLSTRGEEGTSGRRKEGCLIFPGASPFRDVAASRARAFFGLGGLPEEG